MKVFIKSFFVLYVFMFAFSCRQIPMYDESISSKNPVPVKINFLGIGWENNSSEKAQSIENQLIADGKSLVTSELQPKKHAVKINEELYAEIEEIDDTSKNTDLKASLDYQAGIKTEMLKEDAKVRFLVHDSETNSYVKHFDYQINSSGNLVPLHEELKLNSSKKYTIYVISFDNSYLPTSTDLSIPYEFDYEKSYYYDEKPKFLYQKIENYTPGKPLNVKLKHRIAYVRIAEYPNGYHCLDPNDDDTYVRLINDIDSQGVRVLGLHYPKGIIDIENGIVLPKGESESIWP